MSRADSVAGNQAAQIQSWIVRGFTSKASAAFRTEA